MAGGPVYYYFEHSPEGDLWILGEGEQALGVDEVIPSLTFRPEAPTHAIFEECVRRFSGKVGISATSVALKDFRFKQPALDLSVAAYQSGPGSQGELYFYPGEFVDPEIGHKLADIRMEEIAQDRLQFSAESNSRQMVPGFRFTLTGYPILELNQTYLLCSVEHEASQEQSRGEAMTSSGQEVSYRNHSICIPARTCFRPRRKTARPIIPGVQTAIVVGPSGTPIHCDEYGRIRVRFHWDRQGAADEHSSCWIRVAQSWAGAVWGTMHLPRVGQEVVVQFLNGDPDRPLVVGSDYNGDNPVPYTLPEEAAKSVWKSNSLSSAGGHNELRLDDRADAEEIYLHAQKDFNARVQNCRTEQVGGNVTISVGGTHQETIKGDASVTVQEGVLTIQTSQKEIKIVGKTSIKLSSGSASITLKSDGTIEIKGKKVKISAAQKLEAKGGSMVDIKGGVIKLNC